MDPWREHLDREPGLAPCLMLLARKFVRTGSIPKSFTFTLAPEQPNLRRALEFLFGGGAYKDGKLVVRLPERLRTAAALQALADQLGVVAEPDAKADWADAMATALLRQELLFPQHVKLIRFLRTSEELTRLFQQEAQAEKKLHGLLCAVDKLVNNSTAITLSQLGAEALNDSKALRSGVWLKLLVAMLSTVAEIENDTPEQVLARFGVVDNPFTTWVLLYGPVAYEDAHGRAWDWPAQQHAVNQAVALTWAQVQDMQKLYPVLPVTGVITSENAAPFHRLVESRSAQVCVYTEGYPNAAVKRVLSLLAQAGLHARHWGDTDLDGLRIAECVSRSIPMELHAQDPATFQKHQERLIPLTDAQLARARNYLKNHPDFPFRETLERTLQYGWLEQEQTDAPF